LGTGQVTALSGGGRVRQRARMEQRDRLDTLNVASQYKSGVRTWAFASIINWARRSAVASGSAASIAA
jgi:hypothetical protein